MSRNICITSIEGQTGFLIAELLLTDEEFKKKVDRVTGLAFDPNHAKAKELTGLGAVIVPHKPGREREVVETLKKTGCDTVCLVPPARADKFDIAAELSSAAKKAGVNNVLLISAAGCDYAERDKQPRLREFIDLETLVLSSKGEADTPLGNSPCVIRWVVSDRWDMQARDLMGRKGWLLCRESTALLTTGPKRGLTSFANWRKP